LVGDRGKDLQGVTDHDAIRRVQQHLNHLGTTDIKLVAIGPDLTQHAWTLQEELAEMKGHLYGFIRSKYGREMLEAHKLAIVEDFKVGGI